MSVLSTCGGLGAATILALLFVASPPAAWAEPAVPARPDVLAELDLPALPRAAWRFEGFPILAWWPPPGTASADDFARYKAAGFTLYPLNPDAGYDAALRMAKGAGLPILAFRTTQGFNLPPLDVAALDFPEDDPAVIGWVVADEPGPPEDVAAAIREVHRLMAADPTERALFNFFPPHAQPAPGTEAAARAALASGLPILSFDHYVFPKPDLEGREAEAAKHVADHHRNLRLFRRLALEHDVPFWAFALTIEHAYYRRPSASDLRWKQFTNLAYGAKGLWYFTYWAPPDWPRWIDRAIVTAAGEPTDLWAEAKAINDEVNRLGEVLLSLTSTAVGHLDPLEGAEPFEPGTHWLADVEVLAGGGDVVVGLFVDDAGDDYALLVNGRHAPDAAPADLPQTLRLTFAPDVRAATVLSHLDATPGPLPLDARNRATITIPGGTGLLLRAER